MACQFCLTGTLGLAANLSAAQIVEQVVAARRFMAAEGERPDGLTNLVYMVRRMRKRSGLSPHWCIACITAQQATALNKVHAHVLQTRICQGMGEPLHNLDAVLASAEIMNHPLGLHMSHNKVMLLQHLLSAIANLALKPTVSSTLVPAQASQCSHLTLASPHTQMTVSTVGLVDKLDEFVARCSSAQLAVSLHATTDEVRKTLTSSVLYCNVLCYTAAACCWLELQLALAATAACSRSSAQHTCAQ